ncbi:hypothetical protein ACHAXR_008250 [Thalassiosira sp. AJA248-18]
MLGSDSLEVEAGSRRSFAFTTIAEEPVDFIGSSQQSKVSSKRNSSFSQVSITVDDLDPLHRASSLEIRPDQIPRTSLPEEANFINSRQKSSQSKLASALRRFTISKFTHSDSNQGDEVQHASSEVSNPPGRTTVGGSNLPNRRTTIFTRQRRTTSQSSRDMRSSIHTSASAADHDHGDSDHCREVYCLSDTKIHALRRMIGHQAWWGMTLLFILVLLFGPPVQDLWLPKAADTAMDVIYTLAFVVLGIDIIIRSTVDKSYFAWRRKGTYFSHCNRCTNSCKCCNMHAGSFMFWFDTIAVMTILYKISYINPAMAEPHYLRVDLNELGFPKTGRHATPMSIDWPLVLTVGRVALMARFIRTSVLVQLSGSFYSFQYFYPGYWMKKLTSKFRRKKTEIQNEGLASQMALASGSRVPRGREENPDPFSISALGDSRKALEPFSEESDSVPPEEHKPTTMKRFFKGFARNPSGSLDGVPSKNPSESLLFGNNDSNDSGSHVGGAMRELTGQRLATGALLALLVAVICDWSEDDTTKPMTMLTLHGQTANAKFADFSVNVARSSVIPSLFNYTRANLTDDSTIFSGTYELNNDVRDLREREVLSVEVYSDGSSVYTSGQFDNSQVTRDNAKVELVTTILILCVWILGVASFAGPVMTLVVEPIERMVRLLSMLMKDPLGYQSTPQYRKLKQEEDAIANKSMWPNEVLKGMETNFLMSTILRIGSLMRVGFGSAGVEIIKNNLERGRHKDVLFLNKQGSTVSCIFLFCDIRQFTDATECLQEEVFVFTNKIAAVVHSICHAYHGAANKNIGDAFLLSWLLDEAPPQKGEDEDEHTRSSSTNLNLGSSDFYANSNQADKALLSVVKISMALHYDKYFTDGMNEAAKNRLLAKLSTRKGPVVQMGFGLHAGKAVQGAIGSQRKLDATYISESVERSEFLESSTKKYGVPLLMSDAFYNLLTSTNRLRCRKVDQLLMLTEEDGGLSDPNEILDCGEKMHIYTFDMDIEALRRPPANDDNVSTISDSATETLRSFSDQRRTLGPGGVASLSSSKRRSGLVRRASFTTREIPGSLRRRSTANIPNAMTGDLEKAIKAVVEDELAEKVSSITETLVLPTGVHHYNERAWLEPDIKTIRRDYVANGIIFPKYQEGLKAYYAKDWVQAKQCFEFVLSQRDDGPSRYFLGRMEEHGGIPPRNFIGYSIEQG